MDVTNINTDEERMIIAGENDGINFKLIDILYKHWTFYAQKRIENFSKICWNPVDITYPLQTLEIMNSGHTHESPINIMHKQKQNPND